MRFLAVLNKQGGTLRTIDLEAFKSQLIEKLEAAGHSVDIQVVSGKQIAGALAEATKREDVDVVLAGGGDGTVSAAAAALMGQDKALAILPAGTMNLFARSLGIPLTLDAAVDAFATGEVRMVDVAVADGRPFVHQFSIGMHAKMVQLRSKMSFGSRLGKIRASAKAAYYTIMNPPSMKVELRIGEAEIVVETTGIGVTNNLFGEGHLPYADQPDGGVLGIYVTVAQRRFELLKFFTHMARGRWRENDQVEIHQAEKVKLRLLKGGGRRRAVIDGELTPLQTETTIEIHPRALRALVPAATDS